VPVLLDTCAWAWSLDASGLLSDPARKAIVEADRVLVSPITFFEIAQKVRLGKWPEMTPFAEDLPDVLERQGGHVAPFTPAIALDAGLMDWAHGDPFDRLIAATAKQMEVPLVSSDSVFDTIIARIW